VTGYPNMTGGADEAFPWAKSGLNPATQPKDEHGRTVIACEGCPFAQWGPRNAQGKSDPPPCKERHTYPAIFAREAGEPFTESGIVSFQGAGISPSKKYLSGFVRARRALYTAVTEITLQQQKRGSVKYSTPTFAKVGEVPEEDYEEYAREYHTLRDYLRRPPRPGDEGDPAKQSMGANQAAANAGVQNAYVPPQQSTVPAQVVVAESEGRPNEAVAAEVINSTAAQASAPVVSADDDDDALPF